MALPGRAPNSGLNFEFTYDANLRDLPSRLFWPLPERVVNSGLNFEFTYDANLWD